MSEAGAVSPPVNTEAPVVTGDGKIGSTLICHAGVWEGVPDQYEYAWKSDGTTDLSGSADAYSVADTDLSHSITCVVTATNAAGSAEATSNAVVITQEPVV